MRASIWQYRFATAVRGHLEVIVVKRGHDIVLLQIFQKGEIACTGEA